MTFAELIILILALIFLYFLMRPLQHKIEGGLLKFFRSRRSKSDKTVINITDYKKTSSTDSDKDKK